MATGEKPVTVIGIDGSDDSFYALQWTLDHDFTPSDPPSRLVIVHAKPTPSSAVPGTSTSTSTYPPLIFTSSVYFHNNNLEDYIGTWEFVCLLAVLDSFEGPLLYIDADLKMKAARVLKKAKKICSAKSVNDVAVKVVEGDAGKVLCEAVQEHRASILVLGSRRDGAIGRYASGSVGDYCARHAHCTVMVVNEQNQSPRRLLPLNTE